MTPLRHATFFVLYAGLAAAVVSLPPRLLPAIAPTEAAIGGGIVLVLGLLLHEVLIRRGHVAVLIAQVGWLRDAYSHAERELSQLRETVDLLDAAPREGDGREVGEVIAEVKVLQSLIEQLYASRSEDAKAPPQAPVLSPPAAAGGRRAAAPSPAWQTQVMPPVARDLDERALLDALRDGLREQRVELALQPIVSLPQRKRRHYECFSRVRAGEGRVLMPEQYIDLAERAGLITAIDNLLLFRCVQLLRKIRQHNASFGFFCNISRHTLADRSFFGDFVKFMADNAGLASGIVFEFPQQALAEQDAALRRDLDRLARLGFRYSIDQVTDLDLDIADLAARHFRFVKVDAARLLRPDPLGRVGIDPAQLKRRLDSHGLDLIASKIETESVLVELLDLNIDFGQGYLFG